MPEQDDLASSHLSDSGEDEPDDVLKVPEKYCLINVYVKDKLDVLGIRQRKACYCFFFELHEMNFLFNHNEIEPSSY